eukprot:gene6428-11826_t
MTTQVIPEGDLFECLVIEASIFRTSWANVKDPWGPHSRVCNGVVLLIVIVYSGTGMDASLSYQYHVKHVPAAEFKYEEVAYRSEQQGGRTAWRRTVWNRHGVRLVVIDAGQVGAFSFTELLKTLAGGLALLKVARLLVEQVLLRVLPAKKAYKRYGGGALGRASRAPTVDFSERGRVERLTERDFVFGEAHDSATINFRFGEGGEAMSTAVDGAEAIMCVDDKVMGRREA